MFRQNILKFLSWSFISVLLIAAGNLQAASAMESEVAKIQHQWDVINYQTSEQSKSKAFERLAQQAHAVSERYPDRPEPLVWESIVLSSYAGSLSGLSKMGALSKAEQARDLLLKAEKINTSMKDGSIYTSLGALYFKVPGWPLGFGDNKKAYAYLQKALQLNPNGIDPNYFLGELLFYQNKYKEAYQVLQRAQKSPPRPSREIADQGRRKEVAHLIAKVKRFM
ncbi:MAG: tetratricopeptide repeat protein [Gammaproteobacteria bacterium]|jgi:tetratricopeptide (TPR) repeat protein